MSEDNQTINLEPDTVTGEGKYQKLPINPSHHEDKIDDLWLSQEKQRKEHTNEPYFVVDKTQNFSLAQNFENADNFGTNNVDTDTGFRQNTCWNCGLVNHSLNNCPQPKNYQLINHNRNVFHAQKIQQQKLNGIKRSNYQKSLRYFVSKNKLPITNMIVGTLSDELLKALGLPKNGIPLHVYKMRKMGYPNGWLDEARDEFSGITIFTAPNECLPFPGGDDKFRCTVNAKRLHLYPGFNAPCPPDAIDEYEKYGCPQYDPEQSLDNMIQMLKTRETESLSDLSEENFEDTGFASSDDEMKTIDEVHSDDRSSSPEDGEITVNEFSLGTNDTAIEMDTVSLSNEQNSSEEILKDDNSSEEIMKDDNSSEEIMKDDNSSEEIMKDDNSSEEIMKDDNSSEETFEDDNNSEEINTEENSPSAMDKSISNTDITESVNETPSCSSSLTIADGGTSSKIPNTLKRKFGDIKSETLGTPILDHFSAYKTRPSHANFAKGMVDMIDHENLPNAVGTYKTIRELLKDVRKTLNNEL